MEEIIVFVMGLKHIYIRKKQITDLGIYMV